MKLDKRMLLLAVVCFTFGFLLCLALVSPKSRSQPSAPLLAPNPTLAFTQFQPRIFDMASTQKFAETLPAPVLIIRSPIDEIEMMKPRSLDLIDARIQPEMDLKELKK